MNATVTISSHSTPLLLRTARAAAVRSAEYSPDALIAVTFSAFAIESFLNVLLHRVSTSRPDELVGELRTLSRLIGAADLEDRMTPLRRKLEVTSATLAQQPCDFGRRPFQDLGQLQRMRDLLVHSRPETLRTEPAVSPEGSPTDHQVALHDLGEFLVKAGVLDRPEKEVLTSLTVMLQQPATASWAHNTAVRSISAVLAWLPSDGWRSKASFALDLTEL